MGQGQAGKEGEEQWRGGAWDELWFSAQMESHPWGNHPAQEARGPVLEYEWKGTVGSKLSLALKERQTAPHLIFVQQSVWHLSLLTIPTSSSSSNPETPSPNQAQAHRK